MYIILAPVTIDRDLVKNNDCIFDQNVDSTFAGLSEPTGVCTAGYYCPSGATAGETTPDPPGK